MEEVYLNSDFQKETLDRSGIFIVNEVEVIGHMDGTIRDSYCDIMPELCGQVQD